MDELMQATEEIQENLINQDLNEYLDNAGQGQPCGQLLNMQTFEYTPVYDC